MPNPKITIEPVDLSKQKIIEPRLCEVELAPDRFIYRLKFMASEPDRDDEALPWMEVDNDFHFIYKRSAFAMEDYVVFSGNRQRPRFILQETKGLRGGV